MTQATADAIAYARDWIDDPGGGEPGAQCDESIATTFAEALIELSRPSKPDKKRIDEGDYRRASGLVICRRCRYPFFDHPVVPGFEWLHRLCDGRFVKL
jgi:hypothetical protein